METGGTAGSGRALRLDPFALPVRFPAKDAGADGQIRHIELHRERVVMRRSLRGMRMAVGVPVKAFRGVTLRVAEPHDGAAAEIILEHDDQALSVPLCSASDGENIEMIWKAWGRVLNLPLLVDAPDQNEDDPFVQPAAAAIGEDTGRRRRRSAIKGRRPTIFLRRKPGFANDNKPVHSGEREIIARE